MTQPQVPLDMTQSESHTFEGFIGSEGLVESLSSPEKLPQFTYLWGVKHSGKTHLINALAEELAKRGTAHVSLDASMLHDADVFDHLPEGLDFLLLDDVQVLQSHVEGEVALFNVYNWCRDKQCQLVVSAGCSNRSEQWQLPDLRSRLTAGLTLHIEPLKGEHALHCLERQFSLNGIPIDKAVIDYLRTHQNTSFEHLYALFRQVASHSLVLKRKVSVPLIKESLKQLKLSD